MHTIGPSPAQAKARFCTIETFVLVCIYDRRIEEIK
jgi:hypothetical protein